MASTTSSEETPKAVLEHVEQRAVLARGEVAEGGGDLHDRGELLLRGRVQDEEDVLGVVLEARQGEVERAGDLAEVAEPLLRDRQRRGQVAALDQHLDQPGALVVVEAELGEGVQDRSGRAPAPASAPRPARRRVPRLRR